jgi:hypothetical protein
MEGTTLSLRPQVLLAAAERDLAEALELDAGSVLQNKLDEVRALRDKLAAEAAQLAGRARAERLRGSGESTSRWVDAVYVLGFLVALLYFFQNG